MASNINDAFPLVIFVYIRDANDIKLYYLQGQLIVILVNSVVNIDKTIVKFVQHVRKLYITIRIVVITNIVQVQYVFGSSTLNRTLALYAKLYLIALRLFDIKFIDSDITDIDNRLFNTTHLL